MSTGKNSAKTVIRMVPSPNPEKKVRIAVRKVTRLIIINSIYFYGTNNRIPVHFSNF